MHAVSCTSLNLLSSLFMQLMFSVAPLVADVGFTFTRSPEPFIAPLNDRVDFDCALDIPVELIRWRHGRKYLQQNRTLQSRSPTSNQLTIKLESESQLGDYQCVAFIGASAIASVPAKLSLAEMKPFSYSHPPEKRFQVTAGNMVAIYCPPPASTPAALIEYFHDDHKLSPPSVRILPTSNSLLLTNVSAQDSGVYTCSATNYITGQSAVSPYRIVMTVMPSHLVAPSPPKFLTPPQTNYIVQNGSNVTIECVAVAEPPPKVTWSKVRDSQSFPNNRVEYIPGGLHLRNIVPEDTGEYICEISNGISPALQHKVLLHVQEAPVILREPEKTLVEEQGSTSLSCEISGSPIPTVVWTLNGEPLVNDEHISISSSRISIKRAQKKHAGIYQCFATNAVGTVYGSAILQVSPKQITSDTALNPYEQEDAWFEGNRNSKNTTGGHGRGHHSKKERSRKNKSKRKHKENNELMVPPSKPNVTRLSDRSVMVRWHVPPNSGLPISFFKVQHREMGSNESGAKGRSGWMTSNEDIPPHIRSYEVDRLETNRFYKFRVAAVYSNNDNKLSPNSNKFYLHQGLLTERNLIPPTQLSAEALSPSSILIKWQHNNPASPVEGYYVYYRATNNAGDYVKATVEGENTRSFIITHLMPDTSYDIKVQSFTTGSASDFSTIITRKTLVDPTSTTTESTSRNDMKVPNVSISSASSSNTIQLLMVFGGILVALVLLFLGILLSFFIKQRSIGDSSTEDENSPDKNSDNIMTIHPVEPMTMNGFTNHNSKMMNGNVKAHSRNGFISPHTHINITNNPLATESKNEKNMMEMSYLSKYNNNCTIDRCVDSDSDCSHEMNNKWKLREQRPGEKYV